MRLRVAFSKTGAMQYVGHLDLHRSWERSFRRSGLPLAYSQGFHPQPRLNLACALPLGFTSQCEVLDAWLEEDLPVNQVKDALISSLPPGLEIQSIQAVDLHLPSLQTQVLSALYQVTFLDEIPDLEARLQRITSAGSLPRLRRDKPYDLRPLIENAVLVPPGEDGLQRMALQLSARDGATGRPEEVLHELGIRLEDTRILRQMLIFETT